MGNNFHPWPGSKRRDAPRGLSIAGVASPLGCRAVGPTPHGLAVASGTQPSSFDFPHSGTASCDTSVAEGIMPRRTPADRAAQDGCSTPIRPIRLKENKPRPSESGGAALVARGPGADGLSGSGSAVVNVGAPVGAFSTR
jgi:hypothetical protein